MTGFPLLAAGFIMTTVAVLFLVCSVVLILVILIQKGRGGGLSGAFGGGGAGGILGTKTGDFLTWLTIGLVALFLLLAVVMAKFYKPTVSDFGQEQPQQTIAVDGRPQSSEPPTMPPVSGGDANSLGQ